MMITIHGLPPMTTFQTVKTLVRQECNIIDFIVDNLVDDGPNSKKVRIGVSDDAEGYLILKCLNGFRMSPTHILKIVPVGKALNPPPQQNYDQRSGFPNQARNDYPNQPRPDYQQSQLHNDYGNRGPQGLHGHMDSRPPVVRPNINMQRQHGLSEVRQPVPHRLQERRDPVPQESPDTIEPWSTSVNTSNNPWGQQGQGSHILPQDTYSQRTAQPNFGQQHQQRAPDAFAQGRPPPDTGYGFQAKTNEPAAPQRRNALRMVDIVDNTQPPGRPQEKPMTIMKDNFQMPAPFNVGGQPQRHDPFSGLGQGQNTSPVWEHQGQQSKPQSYDDHRHLPLEKRPDIPKQMEQDYDKRGHFSPAKNARPISPSNVGRNYQDVGRRVSPQARFPVGDRRISPTASRSLGLSVREFSPSGRRISPATRRISPTGRRISPTGRRVSPTGRRVSPTSRRISPTSRRISPTGRRLSPTGRRVSPSARKVSPTGRRVSPTSRRVSPPGRRVSPTSRRVSSPGRRVSPTGRRVSPTGRRVSPTGRRVSPTGRRVSPTGRRVSPTSRRVSPTGRRVSPSGRRVSPTGRRVSPSGRRVSPTGRRFSPSGRRVSPVGVRNQSGRRISPPGRRISPTDRKVSPGRRISPGRREEPRRMSPSTMTFNYNVEAERRGIRRSPPKRASPRLASPPLRPIRYSPIHLVDKPADKFTGVKVSKPVRPAYEPVQGPNQAYTGGYRDNAHENVQYPAGGRQEPRMSPWRADKGLYPPNATKDEPRRDKPADKSPPRRSRSPLRRSPLRRSRSPPKERHRRHSPSPRSSRSPRRSWALEKRSSPDHIREPPPPPVWPGQEPDEPRKSRFQDERPEPPPVWERERRPFDEKPTLRPQPTEDGFPSPSAFDDERDYLARADRRARADTGADRRDRSRADHRREERADFRRESPTRDEKVFTDIDKDFHDIYKRAVELRKKTEERKTGERRREEYVGRRREEERYRREESPRREEPGAAADGDWKTLELAKPVKLEWKPVEAAKPAKADWKTTDRTQIHLGPTVKAKRSKAVDHLADRLLERYDIKDDHWLRVSEELRHTLYNIFLQMFGDKDMSFIELVIKFQTKYPNKEEEKLMQEVVSRLPSQYRGLKRKPEGDSSEIPAKTSRRSSPPRSVREEMLRPKLADAVIPEWATGIDPPKMMNMALPGVNQLNAPVVNVAPGPTPMFVPPGVEMSQHMYHHGPQFSANPMQQHPQFNVNAMLQQQQFNVNMLQQQPQFSANLMQHQPQFNANQMQQSQYEPAEAFQESSGESYNLYLCQDDFEPYSDLQADYLKKFLISQIIQATEMSNGWAPDLTLKGLQSQYRYELSTKDVMSKDWVLNLNFSEFQFFNVLVYTKEELWYERAAIWLPGHSRNRMEPFEKLKLQNRRLDGVSLEKWKFVKKIVTVKGTRLYVDMPPSAARGLEKHKMMLSYELQKVNVFLKAVAVDKDAFDSGLKDVSITDPSLLVSGVQNSPMSTLNTNSEPKVIKIGLNGQKFLSVEQARKIKEVIVYFLFKYLKQDGAGKTDFVKFGLCPPSYLGIVPENDESKRWLLSRDFGKMNRTTIVVLGGEDDNKKYFKMMVYIPHENAINAQLAFERLKQSNQGIKGVHFNLWKPLGIELQRKRVVLEIDIDMESIETISKMNYKMDYVTDFGIETVEIRSEYSLSKLEEKIKKCKQEQLDSYDVANMDLESESDNDVDY